MTISPDRAEILSLRRSVRRAEEGHAETCSALARERGRRKATEAALAQEHHARVGLQNLLDLEVGINEARVTIAHEAKDKANARASQLTQELDDSRADVSAQADVLVGLARELDRALLDAVPTKSPQDCKALLERLRDMIPIDREAPPAATASAPAARAFVPPVFVPAASKSVTVARDARGVIIGVSPFAPFFASGG